MKKLLAMMLTLVMLAGQVVFAETDTSGMQAALLTVKSRIDIPAELTEFSSRTASYSEEDVQYTFSWDAKDGTKNMEVVADGDGNIESVYVYDESWYKQTGDTMPRLYDFSGDAAREMATAYLQKLVPQAFADANDRLVYDKKTSGGTLSNSVYRVGFVRVRDGILVPSSTAQVQIRVMDTGAEIANCSVGWDYDAQFESSEGLLENGDAAFQENFPLTFAYRKVYTRAGDEKISLQYTLPNAWSSLIDAKTGKILTEDARDYLAKSATIAGGATMVDSAMDMEEARFTPEELQEIENISGLLSTDELVAKLRAMPELKISEDMTNVQYRLNQQDDTYFYRITLNTPEDVQEDSGYRYMSANFNAKTGEIRSISNGSGGIMPIARNEDGTPKELTDEEAATYRAKADAFLHTYFADKVAEAQKIESTTQTTYTANSTFYVSYQRVIDGILYPDNSIQANWSAASDRLSYYNSTWDADISGAPDKANAVSDAVAYRTILDRNPLTARYVQSDGVYKVAYGLRSTYTTVDAIAGKIIDYAGEEVEPEDAAEFTDIAGHWAEAKIKKLAEYGVKLPGAQFMPDTAITQEDYLMLLCEAANIYYSDPEQMYTRLISRGILTEAEQNPDSPLTKEDALVYLLRAMGVRAVAELEGIYVCDFKDAGDISAGKLGYCAIAKGFGIVSGNGGKLYPQKELTRAEAITLLYQYLVR